MRFSAEDIDAAIAALSQPGRLNDAQELVTHAAPSLERVLGSALHEGGWFDSAHEASIKEAVGTADPHERLVAVRTLFAEETRLTMLVGVAVGLELARELAQDPSGGGSERAISSIDPPNLED
jgi:hypothetical protein